MKSFGFQQVHAPAARHMDRVLYQSSCEHANRLRVSREPHRPAKRMKSVSDGDWSSSSSPKANHDCLVKACVEIPPGGGNEPGGAAGMLRRSLYQTLPKRQGKSVPRLAAASTRRLRPRIK